MNYLIKNKNDTMSTLNAGPNPPVICLESQAFVRLLDETVNYIKKSHGLASENKWIGADQAKQLLGISSSTTLQQLRDQGKLRFSQPMHKVVLYDRNSIEEYLEKHARNTF
jgi:hypothetical protein